MLCYICNFLIGARIRKVISHPTEHSWVMSAVQGNNEISMWNLETGFRQCVLWASPKPALSNTQVSNKCTTIFAVFSGAICQDVENFKT